jgi:hypothetical protein
VYLTSSWVQHSPHSQPQVIIYQLLAHGRWFSLGTPTSSTTKHGDHDIAEILMKVALKHQKSNEWSFDRILFISRFKQYIALSFITIMQSFTIMWLYYSTFFVIWHDVWYFIATLSNISVHIGVWLILDVLILVVFYTLVYRLLKVSWNRCFDINPVLY